MKHIHQVQYDSLVFSHTEIQTSEMLNAFLFVARTYFVCEAEIVIDGFGDSNERNLKLSSFSFSSQSQRAAHGAIPSNAEQDGDVVGLQEIYHVLHLLGTARRSQNGTSKMVDV